MKKLTTTMACAIVLFLLHLDSVALLADPPALGMVADQSTSSVTVFDANSDVVLGSIALPQDDATSIATGDVEIMADHSLGFVTDFRLRVWVIDLQTSPPSLASGINPIPVSNQAEDLVISTDQRYLLVCDGGNFQPLSVVDIASRTEVTTLQVGQNTNAIDICPDNSVLCSSTTVSAGARRVVLGADGSLTDTGEFLSGGANNIYCAPGGVIGLKVGGASRLLVSYNTPGLAFIQQRFLFGSYGISASFSPDGTQVYVRSQSRGNDLCWLEVINFNPTTGAFGPLVTRTQVGAAGGPDVSSTSVASGYFGMDQLAISPDGSKLYVPESSQHYPTAGVAPAIRIYDPATLTLLDEITAPAISRPTGIRIVERAPIGLLVDVRPGSDINPVNLKSKGVLPVAILTTDSFDPTVSVAEIGIADPELVELGAIPVPPTNFAIEDVNGDGVDDLLLFFSIPELVDAGAIDSETTTLELSGTATDGTVLSGSDVVSVVPKGPGI